MTTANPVATGKVQLALPVAAARQPALDGLRVIAAFAVLVVHVGGATGFDYTGTPLSWVLSRCDIGVPIFFTLSGLLLYRPWAEVALSAARSPDVAAYLWRRAVRILPAYWAVVVIALVTLNQAHISSVGSWSQYLLLVQVYDPHPWWPGTGAAGLAQMWSLAVEVSFYAILPLLAGLLTWYASRAGRDIAQRARRLLTGITILTVVSYAIAVPEFYPTFEPWFGESVLRLMTWFTPGMALAVLAAWAHAEPGDDGPVRRFVRTIARSGGACWLVAAMVFVIACTPMAGPEVLSVDTLWHTEIKTALYAIVAGALVAPAAFQEGSRTLLSVVLGNRVMRYLGKISYGIFLWQFVILYGVFAVWHVHDVFNRGYFTIYTAIFWLIVIAAATVVAATLSFYLIEKPAQDLHRAIRARRAGGHHRMVSDADAARHRPATADH